MFKKTFSFIGTFLLCLCLSACQQSEPLAIYTDNISGSFGVTSPEKLTSHTEDAPQTVKAESTSYTDFLTENTFSEVTSEAETAKLQTEAAIPATAAQTEKPAAEWTETAYSSALYVNTDGIYSRAAAIQGSAVVKRYGLNQAVRVIAYTDTDYYKIADGEFIHKDYLSYDRITAAVTTEKTAASATKPPVVTTAAVTIEKEADGFIGKYNMRLQEQWEADFANKVFELTNAERIKNGKPALKKLSPLNNVANIRAWEILTDYRSDHTRPDGEFFSSVYKEQGIQYHYCGENIAAGQTSPENVVNAWMNSPPHRENILSDKFTYLAVGMYYKEGDDFGYYWCQEFCSLFE